MKSEPSTSRSTSHSLIRRAQQADAVAWEALTRIYSPLVYTWAKQAGLQPNDAADVMQDVFQRLVSRLSQFQRRTPNDSFRGWLYTITRNRIRDFYRRRQRGELARGGTHAQQAWNELPQQPADPKSADGQAELNGVRQRALELASGDFESRTWQAFWRTAVQGDSPQDVASDLGISVWAVYKARSRVLAKLKTEFKDLL